MGRAAIVLEPHVPNQVEWQIFQQIIQVLLKKVFVNFAIQIVREKVRSNQMIRDNSHPHIYTKSLLGPLYSFLIGIPCTFGAQ